MFVGVVTVVVPGLVFLLELFSVSGQSTMPQFCGRAQEEPSSHPP